MSPPKNSTNKTLTKAPGSIGGQAFDISDCIGCTLLVLDPTDMVQIDNCVDCRIFIAACCDSVFIRDCKNCRVTVACKQLRTRDVNDSKFYLYAKTEPIIETR